ncbi:hypothetical protein D3C72_2220920 [compost metagenome]
MGLLPSHYFVRVRCTAAAAKPISNMESNANAQGPRAGTGVGPAEVLRSIGLTMSTVVPPLAIGPGCVKVGGLQ